MGVLRSGESCVASSSSCLTEKKKNCSTQHNSVLCSFFPTKSWVDGWVSKRRALRSFTVGVFGRVCASACLLVCRRVFVCVSRAVWDCAGSGTYPARCFLDLSEMPSRDMSLLKTTIPMSMFTWREAQRTIWSGGRLKNGATLNFFYHRSHFFYVFKKKKKKIGPRHSGMKVTEFLWRLVQLRQRVSLNVSITFQAKNKAPRLAADNIFQKVSFDMRGRRPDCLKDMWGNSRDVIVMFIHLKHSLKCANRGTSDDACISK